MDRLPWIRAAGVAGVIGSAAYAAGDVMMLGAAADPGAHPAVREAVGDGPTALATASVSSGRLLAGGMLGVWATPLQLAAAWHLYQGLAPAGRRTALPPAGCAAASWAVASFVHGSFVHAGEAVKLIDDLGPAVDPAVRDRLAVHLRQARRATALGYAPVAASSVLGTVLTARAIATGRTAYPAWSTPLVTPLAPVAAATALTASHVLPGRARHGLQGAGISLGHLASVAASTALLWSGRRLRRARGRPAT